MTNQNCIYPYFVYFKYFNVIFDSSFIIIENGRLSYENPNYYLAGTGHLALDDALNSNLTSTTDSPAGFNLNDDCILYSELLCREFDTVCNINTENINRKRYKSLDLGSMGVDILGQTGNTW